MSENAVNIFAVYSPFELYRFCSGRASKLHHLSIEFNKRLQLAQQQSLVTINGTPLVMLQYFARPGSTICVIHI
jgi:hypothetical protein